MVNRCAKVLQLTASQGDENESHYVPSFIPQIGIRLTVINVWCWGECEPVSKEPSRA